MNSRSIDMQAWADVLDDMEVAGREIVGPVLVTVGAHHRLGEVIGIQTADRMHLLSELPFLDAIDHQLDEQHDAVRVGLEKIFGRGR